MELPAPVCPARAGAPARTTFALAAATAALLVLARPIAARAADDPEQLIQQGIQLRKENDNEGAIKVFAKAYQLKRSPRAAAHLGMAEYRMSRWLEAETHMAEALKAQNDPWIERSRAEIRRSLDEVRTQLGWLEVVGRPAGAEVEVAGRTVGKLPLAEPLRLVTGEVHLRVTMDGFETDRRSVIVRAGETERVVLELEKREGKVEFPPQPPPAVAGPPGSNGMPPIEVRTGAGRDEWRRPAAWVSAGVATLLIGSGIAASVVQSNRFSEFDARKKPDMTNECNAALDGNGGTECTTLLTEGNLAKKLAIGSFIGGGVAAVLSAVFFFTAPAPTEHLAAAPCSPLIGRDGAGATCAWRF